MQAPYQEYIDRLMTIPGVKELSARLLDGPQGERINQA